VSADSGKSSAAATAAVDRLNCKQERPVAVRPAAVGSSETD